MKLTITHRQKAALSWLEELRKKHPANDYGFMPSNPNLAAICRRALEPRGLVKVNRISERPFRYSISDAGRAALSRSTGETE